MMKPKPFSFSSLDTFKNCPKQYRHKYVLRDVREERSAQMIEGENVHLAFQKRVEDGTPLPLHLHAHEPKMAALLAKDGIFWCEEKIALNKRREMCRWDDPDIWWRGIIDFRLVDRDERSATLVDYKTGRPHEKWVQLAMFALHTFIAFPKVDIVSAQFYWTQTAKTTKKVWGRTDMDELWMMFVGDLRQYVQAFKTDTWQERPSGLCRGWCPVTDCQHWQPKRV